jgi:hypothetical protein
MCEIEKRVLFQKMEKRILQDGRWNRPIPCYAKVFYANAVSFVLHHDCHLSDITLFKFLVI